MTYSNENRNQTEIKTKQLQCYPQLNNHNQTEVQY